MDAQQLRRALADFFKFSPKDFVVRGNLTGYNVALAKLPGKSTPQNHPFQLLNASDSEGPKLKVRLDSWLVKSLRASEKVTITGLDSPFPIAVNQAVWLELEYSDPVTIDAATIRYGDFGSGNWINYDSPVAFDDPLAENKIQLFAFRLIGYTQALEYTTQPTGDPALFPDRLVLNVPAVGEEPPVQMQVVQCLKTNLLLCETCFEADTVNVLSDYSHVPSPVPVIP